MVVVVVKSPLATFVATSVNVFSGLILFLNRLKENNTLIIIRTIKVIVEYKNEFMRRRALFD